MSPLEQRLSVLGLHGEWLFEWEIIGQWLRCGAFLDLGFVFERQPLRFPLVLDRSYKVIYRLSLISATLDRSYKLASRFYFTPTVFDRSGVSLTATVVFDRS